MMLYQVNDKNRRATRL